MTPVVDLLYNQAGYITWRPNDRLENHTVTGLPDLPKNNQNYIFPDIKGQVSQGRRTPRNTDVATSPGNTQPNNIWDQTEYNGQSLSCFFILKWNERGKKPRQLTIRPGLRKKACLVCSNTMSAESCLESMGRAYRLSCKHSPVDVRGRNNSLVKKQVELRLMERSSDTVNSASSSHACNQWIIVAPGSDRSGVAVASV